MTDVEERTINLIVEVTGIQRKRVQLSSRLVDDIGMDGDDAIDSFKKFGQSLHVDLDVLYEHWDNHFFPEGFGGMSIGYLVIIVASVIVGGLVHAAVSRIPVWLAMMGVMVLSFWICGKFFVEHQPAKTPITVQDLVAAASSGKWVIHYGEAATYLFRTLQ
jgi:hypothetical protein